MEVYFERYAWPGPLIQTPPAEGLRLSVVIPCYDEPALTTTLTSLAACQPPPCPVEVLVVVNEPDNAPADIRRRNRHTSLAARAWQQQQQPWYHLHLLEAVLPARTAGVGLARKVGMDEAARRFSQLSENRGLIICLDADCTVAPNYLTALYEAFFRTPAPPAGAVIYFEHPLPADPGLRSGIVRYELHLRYYVQALRFSGYPYARHTVGSAMAVRQDMYIKAGGMNKRQAGEDFYFLHRLMPLGSVVNITQTTVYPAGRPSGRVPFGTGRAMIKWLKSKNATLNTYSFQSFRELRVLWARIAEFYRQTEAHTGKLIADMPPAVRRFLEDTGFAGELPRLNRQSSTPAMFRKNWFAYFDGFRVLRFLHFARDHFYPDAPVEMEAARLARQVWQEPEHHRDAAEWLVYYRERERNPTAD